MFKHYWPRLLITCGGWVANDFAFYGNKLFQSKFIAIISPGASQYVRMKWTLLNSSVALLGCECMLRCPVPCTAACVVVNHSAQLTHVYNVHWPEGFPQSLSVLMCLADYAAAYTIDRKWMGRKRLQASGFLMM